MHTQFPFQYVVSCYIFALQYPRTFIFLFKVVNSFLRQVLFHTVYELAFPINSLLLKLVFIAVNLFDCLHFFIFQNFNQVVVSFKVTSFISALVDAHISLETQVLRDCRAAPFRATRSPFCVTFVNLRLIQFVALDEFVFDGLPEHFGLHGVCSYRGDGVLDFISEYVLKTDIGNASMNADFSLPGLHIFVDMGAVVFRTNRPLH